MKIGKITIDVVYELIYWFIENGDKKQTASGILFSGLPQFNEMISWKLTGENLRLLYDCVNGGSGIDEDKWIDTQAEFVASAFKDLSSLRNPHAMSVFEKIRIACDLNRGELFLWGRNVVKRSDGSAVMVMHVSDLEAFEKMLHHQHGYGFLQEGLIIYR